MESLSFRWAAALLLLLLFALPMCSVGAHHSLLGLRRPSRQKQSSGYTYETKYFSQRVSYYTARGGARNRKHLPITSWIISMRLSLAVSSNATW